MSKSWANGSSYQWRKTRAMILEANQLHNGGRCRLQIPEVCTGVATQVHHTEGRARTGDDPRYLLAVCRACNLKVGDPTKGMDPPGIPLSHWD